MTVSGTTYKNTYILDSSTTVFPYTFKIVESSDMLVTLYDTTSNTSSVVSSDNYTVVGAGNDSGTMTVTWANASNYGSTYQLILQSNSDYTQPTDYEEGDDFAQETHELALDRLSIQIRQLIEVVNRSLKLDVSTTTTSAIPDNAGYLYSDGDGNLVFGTPSGVSDTLPPVTVSDVANGLIVNDDGDAFKLATVPYLDSGTFAHAGNVSSTGNISAEGNISSEGTLTISGACSLAGSFGITTSGSIPIISGACSFLSLPSITNTTPTLDGHAANKKYVDDRLGSYVTTNANQVGGTTVTLAYDTWYVAAVTGILVIDMAEATTNSAIGWKLEIDTAGGTTATFDIESNLNESNSSSPKASASFPIPKGYGWRVVRNGTPAVILYFIPL